MLKLVHVNYIWIHSTFLLFTTPSCTVTPLFSGEAPAFLWLWIVAVSPLASHHGIPIQSVATASSYEEFISLGIRRG